MITKEFKGVIKGIDKANHTVEVMVSGPGIDRDQEIIVPEAYESRLNIYKSHPVLVSSHNSHGSLMNNIGKAEDIYIGDGLVAKFKYFTGQNNPEADYAWYLVEQGLGSWSVGFLPLKWEEGSPDSGFRRKFTEVELYEISQVIVPSFRGAIQNNYGDIKDENFLAISKAFYGKEVEEVLMQETIEKSGRVLSEKTRKKLCEIHEKIHSASKEFKALLDETQLPEELPQEDDSEKGLEIDNVEILLSEIKKNLQGGK